MCQWCNTNVPADSKLQWGLTRPMCQEGLKRCLEAVRQRNPHKDYENDYARLYALMCDKPLFRQQLRKLEMAISANSSGATGETNWLRLSSILGYYERQCWFPPDILLPMGLLSSQDFYFYIRHGYVLKDYGAGVRHGEFTHRVQWHVVMGVITKDFTVAKHENWDHSPFELYVSLGKPENEGLWGLLFDLSGTGLGEPGPLRFPDGVHAWLLSEGLGNLAGFLTKRETKRRLEFIDLIDSYINDHFSLTDQKARDEFLKTTDPNHSHEAFKLFEGWFIDRLRRQQGSSDEVVKKLYEAIDNYAARDPGQRVSLVAYIDGQITPSDKVTLRRGKDPTSSEKDCLDFIYRCIAKRTDPLVQPIYNQVKDSSRPDYLARKTADVGSLKQKPKYRSKKYVLLNPGAVYALEGTVIMSEQQADQRAQTSHSSLFKG